MDTAHSYAQMSPHGESRRGPNEEASSKRGLGFLARVASELPCIYFEKTCEVRRLRAAMAPRATSG